METAAACCVHSSMANSQSLPGIMSAQKVVRVRRGGGGGEGAAERRVTFSGGASSSPIGFNRSEQWGSSSATTIAISSSKRGGLSLHTTVGPLKVHNPPFVVSQSVCCSLRFLQELGSIFGNQADLAFSSHIGAQLVKFFGVCGRVSE
jgi:hypothetical protein